MESRCDLQNARVASKLGDQRVRTRGFAGLPLPPGNSLGLTSGTTRVPQIHIVIRLRGDRRPVRRAARNNLLERECPLRPVCLSPVAADVVLNLAELCT